ncbi:RNA polymerase sigma factor SigJ [Rugosimonospora africana]|uniref:RNA polymerase sigma factor SigJ n=1 Tax=Rugosimonospora africana TaxID=556532 RepID=A0A8J3VN19_9ACTN|nr:RNA polymerase sigma factor SigJ [Rugosimonospora africana]GIH12372.1 RNA polymerase sigma factor SigJ [Rugosimonospora africana]
MVDESGGQFEEHRGHLFGVAYRMLGSRSEAEDAVQETWLRYASSGSEPADLRAWLTTVIGRICLDVLRSARVRREAYVGQWLPEPIVTRLPSGAPDPADEVAQHEQVSLALLVVLERLTPEQRVAFVLHDVFAVPFESIAATLDTTPAAARQLATRARRTLAGPETPRHTADLTEQRRVMSAFVAAAARGDLDGLVRILAPDVVVTGDGGGLAPASRQPVVGASQVSRFVLGLFRQADRFQVARAELALVNGDLGLVIDGVDPAGNPSLTVVALAVADGKITAVYNQLNPNKLREVPRPDAATASWPPTV